MARSKLIRLQEDPVTTLLKVLKCMGEILARDSPPCICYSQVKGRLPV